MESITYFEGVDAPIDEDVVREVDQLKTGDPLEAWHNGKLYHFGVVLRTVPSLGLVTISTSDGGEALLDAHVLTIARRQVAETLNCCTPSR